MSKSNFVICKNNGTTALMLEDDFRILKNHASPEIALAHGVRWYIFMKKKRLWRSATDNNFFGAPVATDDDLDFLMKEAGWESRTREEKFFVPFSNGPRNYWDERGYIFSLTELLFRAASG